MKIKVYLKWIFTRWYYWLILILLTVINSEIRNLIVSKDYSFLIGYLFGMMLILATIFYSFYFIYQRGFRAGKEQQ